MKTLNRWILPLVLPTLILMDLLIFPNCIPPSLDSNPEVLPVKEKTLRVGYDGFAILPIIPYAGTLEYRNGLGGNQEIGASVNTFNFIHTAPLSPKNRDAYSSLYGSIPSFVGGELSLKSNINSGITHQIAVAAAQPYSDGFGTFYSVTEGLLFGTRHFHLAPRLTLIYQDGYYINPSLTVGKISNTKWPFHIEGRIDLLNQVPVLGMQLGFEIPSYPPQKKSPL